MSVALLVEKVTLGEILIHNSLRSISDVKILDATLSDSNLEEFRLSVKSGINRILRKNLRAYYASRFRDYGISIINPTMSRLHAATR